MTEQAERNPDVAKAFKAITGKRDEHNKRFDYYDGEQKLVYSSKRLEKVFRKSGTRFLVNWSAVVVNVPLDRLELQRFEVSDLGTGAEDQAEGQDLERETSDLLTDRLDQLLDASGILEDEEDLHTAVLVAGEAYVIAWPDADEATGAQEPTGPTQAYYNDPRLCHVQYDPGNPRRKLWAAKLWTDDDGFYRLVLYYPDHFEYYHSTKPAKDVQEATGLELDTRTYQDGQAPNERGVIPMFHFCRVKRKIRGEIDDIKPLQDGANKLFADMMVVAEYGAFRQRYAVSDADLGEIENLPGAVWLLPAGDAEGTERTQVGEFEASELSPYLEAIDRIAAWASTISRTPKHYLFSQGGDPSGEALLTMEAPLNKKVQRIIASLSRTWVELAAFLLLLDGQTVDDSQIKVTYASPETVQPKTRAEIRQTNRGAGLPWPTILREEGKTEPEVNQVMQEIDAENARATRGLAQALLAQQRRFDQNQQRTDEGEQDVQDQTTGSA